MIPVKLKTLTPVHIGSGNELARDVEFIEMDKSIGVIDDRKTLEVIGEENLHQWVSIIEKQEQLLDYLKKRKPNLQLNDVCKRTMPLLTGHSGKMRTLKEQLLDGMGKPIIPGSSIKGSIRTAILNILQNESGKNWTEREITNRRGRINDNQVQKWFFGQDPNHDFMRFVKTGDALFMEESLVALPVLSLNYLYERTKRDEKFLQLTEAIGAGAETNFRMKLDLDLWQKNLAQNETRKQVPGFMKGMNFLFSALNDFTAGLLENELDFWEEDKKISAVEAYMDECNRLLEVCRDCKENEAVIRVGHGSGWIFMTGGWIKNPAFINDQGSNNLYDKIIDKTRPKNFRYKDHFFPKTRRMDEEGELLGFVKLSIAE